ncbi:MAG: ArsA family ATPase [Acidimicrobiales bacterium]
MSLLDRRLLVVTGKGGVGKTMVSAALARCARAGGRRVLVCEVDAKGSLATAFEAPPVGFEPVEIEPGLHLMTMDTEASLREYLRLHLHLPMVGRIGPLAAMFDFVARAAPGVREILIVGKLAYEVRERHFDLVVVDAPSSGHVGALLAAPHTIGELVKVGQIRTQTEWMADILADPALTAAVVVTTPEEMPVVETLELLGELQRRTPVQVAAVVVNKVLPELFNRAEQEVFDQLCAPGPARQALVDQAGAAVAEVLTLAEQATRWRRSRVAHLDRLRAALPAEITPLYLPFLFGRSHGARAVNLLAEALADELD